MPEDLRGGVGVREGANPGGPDVLPAAPAPGGLSVISVIERELLVFLREGDWKNEKSVQVYKIETLMERGPAVYCRGGDRNAAAAF